MKYERRFPILFQAFLFLLSLTVLGVIIWVSWQIVHQPDLGVLWDENGVVYYAKPLSPIVQGDQIIAIDQIPVNESEFPYFNWQRGDEILLTIAQGNGVTNVVIDYNESSPAFILALRFSVMIVVFAFWLAGTTMILFLPQNRKIGRLFFFWCQLLALSLGLGNVTHLPWTAHLSIFFTLWVIPFSIHLHMLFPLQRPASQTKLIVPVCYGITIISALEVLAALNLYTFNENSSAFFELYFLGWVSFGLVAVITLLAKAYFGSPNNIIRQQVGFVATVGTLSLLPLLIFTILPNILVGNPLGPAEFMFVFLIGIPLGYTYAIRRYKVIKLEKYISRTTITMLVLGVLGLIYFSLTIFVRTYLPPAITNSPYLTFLLILLLIGIHNPLRSSLQKLVDKVFYGGWYDYPAVIGEIAGSLENTTDVLMLAETFSIGIRRTMRVHWTCLILPEAASDALFYWISGTPESPMNLQGLHKSDLVNIEGQLKESKTPLNGKELLQLIGKENLTQVEEKVLLPNLEGLWVPVKGKNNTVGLLILGPRFGGDIYDEKDMEILYIVARQVSIAFQKTQLIAELTQAAQENERYQKEIIRTREAERKRIARDLHDLVIQELIGLNYQIANMSDSNFGRNEAKQIEEVLKDTVITLIQTTREICANLRPPALDLGLVPSIRSLVARYERKTTINYSLAIEGDRSLEIPEEISLCLYQFAVESLSNIRKHSFAENVCLQLIIEEDNISLTISDDGNGFVVPERLGSLMQENHYGLVGIRERMDLIGGGFQVISAPQQGTKIKAIAPVTKPKEIVL